MIDPADLYRAEARTPGPTGVLVLAGSSGRVDTGRVDLLADHGATALGLRWFGGATGPSVPRRVPLERFTDAIDVLAARCDRIVLVGLSYGAEAALLVAAHDPRVAAVVALAPTDVVWEGHRFTDDAPAVGKWSLDGEELPFVPLDPEAAPTGDPPSFTPQYRRSLEVAPTRVQEAARIRVERIAGEVVLVAGGDDAVWPAAEASERIRIRRARHALPTTVVVDERAGHPVTFPGETAPDPRRPYRVGGDDGAAERLGRAAWPHVLRVLRAG